MTTPEQIAASLSPGAARAVMAMTGEWANFVYEDDSWVDRLFITHPSLIEGRGEVVSWQARLKPLGQQVKDVLLKIEQETKP